MRAIVMFGGGGALGAFDVGVWQVLAPALQAIGARLAAVGGASIGAVNAAMIASVGDDPAESTTRLETAWRDEFATPSMPFAGVFDDAESRSWNGVLTGLLVGNRQLYRAAHEAWNPFAGMQRRHSPLLDRSGMWAWLERQGPVPRLGGAHPLLAVAAVDVMAGELAVFDNADSPVLPAHLAASSAIPLMFEPVEVDGRLYWDGDITHEPALPSLLDRVRAHVLRDDDEPTVLIAVDHMPRRQSRMPQSGLELTHRALELLLHGKTRVSDEAFAGIDHVIRIEREALPHDVVSGQFDYSPRRIGDLITQGREQASRAWDGFLADAPQLHARAAVTRHDRPALH